MLGILYKVQSVFKRLFNSKVEEDLVSQKWLGGPVPKIQFSGKNNIICGEELLHIKGIKSKIVIAIGARGEIKRKRRYKRTMTSSVRLWRHTTPRWSMTKGSIYQLAFVINYVTNNINYMRTGIVHYTLGTCPLYRTVNHNYNCCVAFKYNFTCMWGLDF